jgi:hypothetical protein
MNEQNSVKARFAPLHMHNRQLEVLAQTDEYQMNTRLIIGDVLVLKNGMVAIGGRITSGRPPNPGAIGKNSSGSVEVEFVSHGMVHSSPPSPRAEAFLVRVLKGSGTDLEGCTLEFGYQNLTRQPSRA